MSISSFDIEAFFHSKGHQVYHESRGWVNIDCPYCVEDTGHHLGIHAVDKNFNCWKCGESGSIYKLLFKLFTLSKEACDKIFESGAAQFEQDAVSQIKRMFSPQLSRSAPKPLVDLPLECKPVSEKTVRLFPLLSSYLKRRNLSVGICEKNRAGFCPYGTLSGRMILPIYFRKNLVAFQARDTTNSSRVPKYLTYPREVVVGEYLYGFDSFSGEEVVVVEGIFDQWAVPNSVCVFGSSITPAQACLLLELGATTVTIALDPDVYSTQKYQKLKELIYKLLSVGRKVKVARLPKGQDPASLGEHARDFIGAAEYVSTETFGRRYLEDRILVSK